MLLSASGGSGVEAGRSGVLENSKGGGMRILLSAPREGIKLSGIGSAALGRRGDGTAFWTLTGLIGSTFLTLCALLCGLLVEGTVGGALGRTGAIL